MNRLRTQAVALLTTYRYSPSPIARPDCVRYFPSRTSFAYLLAGGALLVPMASFAQTLNDAVASQLEFRNFVPCAQLRAGQPIPDSYLTGRLLAICKRGGGSAGTTPSVSTGGGAATPTNLPSIVQKRLREAGGKTTQPTTGRGASADNIATFENGLSLFISGEFENLDRNGTAFEDGYDSDFWRITAGADAQVAESLVAGLAVDGSWQDGDFDGGGDFEVQSYGIVGFGIFLPTDTTFVQFYGGFARDSYSRDRNGVFTDVLPDGSLPVNLTASGIQNADYDADKYRAGVLLGYNYAIDRFSISPRAGLDWAHTNFETYSETGDSGLELTFHDDDQTWLQTRVGVQLSVDFRTVFGLIVPQASFDWKHEFENDQRNVQVSFVGDMRANRFSYQTQPPDHNWFEFNAGVVASVDDQIQLFGNYRTIIGHKFFDSHAGTIGLRIAF